MNNCKFCGIKLEKNDRICPNCGGAVTGEMVDVEKLEKTIDKQEDTIEELQNNVNEYKDKHSKKSALIVVLIIIIVFMLILPITCCFFVIINTSNINDYDDYEYSVDDYEYDWDNETITDNENSVALTENIKITINGEEKYIPSLVGEFIEDINIELDDTYIINAKSSDYVRSDDYSINLNIENSTDDPLNYTDCQITGIRIYTDNYYDYKGIESLHFYGLTLDTTPEGAVELFGEPSMQYTNDYCIYKEWKTDDGWFEASWSLEEKLQKFACQIYYTYY